MNAFETVLYQKDGPIAWITLNRPHALNAYNTVMRDELYQLLQAVRDDPEVKGAVIKGAGERAFCAGADLTEFGTAPSQAIARKVRWSRDIWGLFLNVQKPLVAAVHGYVLGSGLEIALLCDFRIASQDAVFGLPELQLGMVPAAGGTQTLSRLVGQGVAMEMLLTGRRASAQEAQALGLVAQVVPRERLLTAARALLEEVLQHDPRALRLGKIAVLRGVELPLDQGLALEARLATLLLRRRRPSRSRPRGGGQSA